MTDARGVKSLRARRLTNAIHSLLCVGEHRWPEHVSQWRARRGKTVSASMPTAVCYARREERSAQRRFNRSITEISAARDRERKPSAAARRQTARPAARMNPHLGCTLLDGKTQRRRLAQQRAQRQTARAALLAQRREERMEPGADTIDGPGVAPLFSERAGSGGMMTQRPHHVTVRGTRRFQRGVGKTGAQKSMHGFTSRQWTAHRQVRRNAHGG